MANAPDFAVLQAAADWFAVLGGDHAGPDDRQRWQAWMDASVQHRDAWRQVEAISARMQSVRGAPARRALAERPNARRALLRNTTLGLLGLLAGWQTLRQPGVQRVAAAWRARHRTGLGETRFAQLPDGSRLWLNTDTAADDRYTAELRRIQLHAGEILVETAADRQQPVRPLVVDVAHARLRALGTRFIVRLHGDWSELSVLEGAVEVRTPLGALHTVVAGGHARIRDEGVTPLPAAASHAGSWVQGMLTADGMRLDDFLAELGRYRRGYLGCAPEVAALRLTGVYPLADTDMVLQALQESLPVQVRHVLPWWVSVNAR